MASIARRGNLKLRIELVPKPLWGRNLRSNDGLGKKRWDKLRHKLVESDGARCAICGNTEKKLNGHEVWDYREKKTVGTAALLRVEIVCVDCHDIHHWARTTRLFQACRIASERYGFLRKHFRKVNGCRQADFDRHFLHSMRVWSRQSKKRWKIDWGAFASPIAEANAARETWAGRNPGHPSQDDPFNAGVGHHMPQRCPECGAVGKLRPIEGRRDEMSEGQEADYDQGVWGFAFCAACQSNVVWGV
jgi:hypothetical protein